MKLYLQPNGSVWAVGIETNDPEKMTQQFNSFYNHGAVEKSSDIVEMSPSFSYIWTNKERLEKYFRNSSLFKLLGDDELTKKFKGVKGGLMERAKELGRERMNSLIHDRWVFTTPTGEIYHKGTIAAEKPDPDS